SLTAVCVCRPYPTELRPGTPMSESQTTTPFPIPEPTPPDSPPPTLSGCRQHSAEVAATLVQQLPPAPAPEGVRESPVPQDGRLNGTGPGCAGSHAPLPDQGPHTLTAVGPTLDWAVSLAGLPTDPTSLTRDRLLSLLRADQRRRWHQGQRVSAESYRDHVRLLRDDPDALIDLIYSEALLRAESGEATDVAEY